jgi:hypothetical protein
MVQITRRQVVSTTLSEPELKALEIWCTEANLKPAIAIKTAINFTLRNKHLLREQQA